MNEDLKNILKRVRELYNKYGIKSITMDDVAHELGISKKTLYQFVSDKDDLVGKFIDNEIEIRQVEICKCFKIGLNAIEELFEISLFMNKLIREQNPATEYDLKKYYPHHFQKIVKIRRERMYSYILLNLQKGKEEGLYREDMNEDVIAKLHLSRSESIHFEELFTIEEFTSVKLFIELLSYHVRGIATEKGINVLENKIKQLESNNI
ncbi:MAG: TetR/AcrR family transcriptional regulator [Bacteroidales bacterium]|nr:MAG: TetR/AcrR family transcriptional regulator [Bacteroidales bacterium]